MIYYASPACKVSRTIEQYRGKGVREGRKRSGTRVKNEAR